jgi:hypothetical protein
MKSSEFYRNFSLGLVYPAVLGTLIFQLIDYSSSPATSGLYWLKIKVLSFLVVIYSLDFLKNSLEKYNLTKVFFDLFTIFGLYSSYSALNFSDNSSVNLNYLSFSYFILTGAENAWILMKDMLSKKNSKNDELTKKVFNLNKYANTVSLLCAGALMFGSLKFAKSHDYDSWSTWFSVASCVIIISELMRVSKLVFFLTQKD